MSCGVPIRMKIIWDGKVIAEGARYTATQANGWKQSSIIGGYEYKTVLDEEHQMKELYIGLGCYLPNGSPINEAWSEFKITRTKI